MTKTSDQEVIQADREAAADLQDYLHQGETPVSVAKMRDGGYDHVRFVQAFAAHRIAHTQAWQPIDTAPKDGTEVLVYIRRKVIRLGWYFAPSSRTFGWRDENSRKISPTHWMPLPSPPETPND